MFVFVWVCVFVCVWVVLQCCLVLFSDVLCCDVQCFSVLCCVVLCSDVLCSVCVVCVCVCGVLVRSKHKIKIKKIKWSNFLVRIANFMWSVTRIV